jgi:dUTP pyrophosphatase
MEVKVVLEEGATMPTKAHETDAGYDLVAVTERVDKLGFLELDTGVRFAIPEGHVGYIFPRSSISNKNMRLTNSVGVIDSGYTGTVKFRFRRDSIPLMDFYKPGDKVGQLIIMPIPEVSLTQVENLETTDRGDGGYGSTDEVSNA